MSEVIVDKEKLAHGLKRGVGHTDTIFASGPLEQRLRYTPCGLVSSAIHEYCRSQDIPSRLVISSPKISFDPEMQHVVPIVGESATDGLIVDASYSQFLGYVGLNWGYEKAAQEQRLPNEEILTFTFSERDVITDWLTDVAVSFKANKDKLPSFYDDIVACRLGNGPLTSAVRQKVKSVYSSIWDPANMKAWEPGKRVTGHGLQASRFIPEGAITID